MRKIHCILIVLLIFINSNIYSQKKYPDDLPCTEIISQLSYFWQLDSLANNGFRIYALRSLLTCVLAPVNREYLLMKFGQPNRIRENNETVSYIYYCFSSKNMPPEYKGLFDELYVSFTFNKKGNNLISIKHDIFN